MTQKPYQVFSSMEELEKFIVDSDSLKEFKPVKRKINWNFDAKICEECEEPFKPSHIAQHFCEKCQKKSEKQNKRDSVVHRMKRKPTIAQCSSCNKDYYRSVPTMHYCERCSTTGGQLVSTGKYKYVENKPVPKIPECKGCGKKYYRTAPAMRYCKCCSPKGGELIEEPNSPKKTNNNSKSNVLNLVK